MRIAVTHITRLDYETEAVDAVTDARLGPLSDDDQQVERFAIRVSPTGTVRPYTDGYGNAAHFISVSRPHSSAEITAESEVRTLLADPFELPAERPAVLTPAEVADYLHASALVPSIDAFRMMAAPYRPESEDDVFEAVRGLTQLVYEGFRYETDATTVTTPVADVIEQRVGVCQDFAHVLLGLVRAAGVPARYVSGYIVPTQPAAEATPLAGNGNGHRRQRKGPSAWRGAQASHAWVEAWTPTHGWRGFDPTNNLVANDQFVKMAIGRDYRDAAPTRGVFHGVGKERLTVEVSTRILGD